MSDGFWRIVFLTAAIFNWFVGVSQMFDVSQLAASMGQEAPRYDALYSPLLGWLVILFGALYFVVYRNLENRAIVLIGLAGKGGVFVLVVAAWWRGQAPNSMATLVFVDAIYAALFAIFLLRRQPAISKS